MNKVADFYRGDTVRWRLDFKNDIAGGSLLFTMKRRLDDADEAAVKQVNGILDAPDGQGEIFGGYIDLGDTKAIVPGKYFVGFQFTNAQNEVATLTVQQITVKHDAGGSV